MDILRLTLKHDLELGGLLTEIVEGSPHIDGKVPPVSELVDIEFELPDRAQAHAIIKQLILVEGLMPKFTPRMSAKTEEKRAERAARKAEKESD